MFVVCVNVHVKQERVDDFIAALLDNARNTRGEPGNLQYDVCQQEGEPARFFIYEVYRTAEDFTAHQRTPHYLEWRERVADWMAEPRIGVKHRRLFPVGTVGAER